MRLTAISTYKIISLICCLVLSGVQTFLVYNTFKLENEHYYVAEKEILNDEYSRSISNDKIFPGGQKIIDHYIYNNIQSLEYNYKNNKKKFAVEKEKVCDSIFSELRQKNNLDSLLPAIIKRKKLQNNFEYAATIVSLEIAFELNKYIPLYISDDNKNDSLQKNGQQIIGGTLQTITRQNTITALTVSTPMANTYRMAFSLHMDSSNREMAIVKQMLPTLLLSISAIFAVVIVFYITFRNWVKQKKIADMQSDFVNNITHEFHTPLAAIIVANKNIQLDKIIGDKEKIKPLTEVIQRQSERLQHLINQVIDITQINHKQLKLQETSLLSILNNVIADYQLKITNPNIHLLLDADAEDHNIQIDHFWFTTLLTNLMDNAIKYNINKNKNVIISVKNEDAHILLLVEDNGVGIKKEMLKNIFEKFYRVPGALKMNDGLGLGLYLVKAAVDAHQWQIHVESEEGKGTKFNITITK